MASQVNVKLPNPQVPQAVANQHNPTKMYHDCTVMPFSYCTINKMTSGLVGELKDDYLYPQYLFFDAGCGQTVLEFDQPLPDNWQQIFAKVANESFDDPQLDALLPNEVFQFDQSFTLDKQLKAYIENMRQYKETHIDDDYLNSQIIPELIPYINGELPIEQLAVIDYSHDVNIDQSAISPSSTGVVIDNNGGNSSSIDLLGDSIIYTTMEVPIERERERELFRKSLYKETPYGNY